MVLAVTYNTTQLVDVIVETLLAQKQQLSSTSHKLVVTGRDPVPVEISHGMIIRREDLRNAHEVADVIIIHQMLSIVESSTNDTNISVTSDDTDVFILLVQFYHDDGSNTLRTESIDIQAIAHLHKDIARQLLAAHTLSGCNIVAQLWGIGKTRVVTQVISCQKLGIAMQHYLMLSKSLLPS